MARKINVSGVLPDEISKQQLASVGMDRLSDEVLTADALKKFPDLAGLEDRDMLVMMAVAHGFSYRSIAESCGIAIGTVANISRRVDPCGMYRLDQDGMKAFVAKRARAKTSDALSLLTMDEMKDCSQVQIAKIAKTTAEISAIQERKDTNTFGDKKIKKVIVEFRDFSLGFG